jgi:UDP-glucose 4-epimerase
MSGKVLIIGGGGFIGSWLSRELIKTGYTVTIIDPFVCYSGLDPKLVRRIIAFRKSELLKGVKMIHGQYEKTGRDVIKKIKPDIVVHLAATPLEKSGDPIINDRLMLHDIPLTYKIASDVAKSNVKKFIYMSSIFAYGNYNSWSVSEDISLNPSTLYGISKASSEFIIKNLLAEKEWIIVRTTSVYGFGDTNLRATQIFMNNAFKNTQFWVNKDSWPDFIYIKDLVEGLAKIIKSNVGHEIIHISGGHAVSLAKFVKEMTKYFRGLDYVIKENINDRPRRGTMDNTKARVILNWEPKFTLSMGVKDYLNYAKKFGHG